MTSLFRFIKANEIENLFPDSGLMPLKLTGLKIISEINGKEYLELDRVLRSNIAKRAIRCIVVLNESDEALKFEVFERLNTGVHRSLIKKFVIVYIEVVIMNY